MSSCFIRLRGLPFSAKEDDVRNFLQGLLVRNVAFTLTATGRASGECYVELPDLISVEEARKFDKKEMNGRYIEVFTVNEGEANWMMRHGVLRGGENNGMSTNFVVRLRGIPFSSTHQDIKDFFSGLEVADVVIDKEPGGRPSGEAFVRFATKQHAEMALERNKKNMGSRYVEVFRSSGDEMETARFHGTFSGGRSPYPMPRGEPVPLRGLMTRGGGGFGDRYGYGGYGSPGGPIRGPMGRGGGRPAPYDAPYDRFPRYGGGGGGYGGGYDDDDVDFDASTKVFMRGLPYNANAMDIEDFFSPLNCTEIRLGYNEDRRPSGDAYVLFSTMAEARDALSRNKKSIGTRYIELFSGANMPPSQKMVTYRRIGGTGLFGPRPGPLSGRSAGGGYSNFDGATKSIQDLGTSDEDFGSNYSSGGGGGAAYGGGSGGQQYYNDEYEGRQSGYGRQWGGGSSIKAAW